MILDRIIAQAGDFSTSSTDQEERRRQILRLVEGVRYTGRFVVTYQAVLVGLILLFSVRHGWHRFSNARKVAYRSRQSCAAQDGSCHKAVVPYGSVETSGSSSSGSSTLEGNVTPPESKTANDSTPLLGGTISQRTWTFIIKARVQAFLMYQPRPIPKINKTLPENATTLLVLSLLGLEIFYLVYKIDFKIHLMFVFADRTGLLFAANLPWLYFLGAKNQPLRLLTGYAYEHLNIIHRRLGEWMCFLALLHSGGMFIVWYDFFRPTGRSLWWFLGEKTVYLGLITLACYELLYVTSLASFRQWWYEMFLGLHVFLQAGALGFLFFHHPGSRIYVGIALAVFLVDRLIFRLALKSRSFSADLAVMGDRNTVLVSVNWPLPSRVRGFWAAIFMFNIVHGWDPAEHVFLTVPALAPRHIIQAHPFTIASAAPEREHEHAWLNLVIRALDGFTRDLLVYAQTHSSVKVRLDGPYGSAHALDMLRASDLAVLVAGGSGIAVAYPMLWSLLNAGKRDTEAAGAKQQVCLIWIVNDASHIAWIGQERLDELQTLGLRLVLPPPTREAGRPDVATLVRDTIDELTSDVTPEHDIGVMVSGPDGMNRAARNACSKLVSNGRKVDVSVEKFGW